MSLVFHADLLERRAQAIEVLETADIFWLRDYSSIDIDHAERTLEICGLRDQRTMLAVESALGRAFRGWRFYGWLKDWGIEQGWVVTAHLPSASRDG